ncbi:hypothetical protein ABPG74_012171 [Tetrahymena malaccensis]
MEYRYLGNTGLKVSVISFGNWLNSNDSSWTQRTIDLVKKAHSLGINFFDTAEVYGYGEAEKQMGLAIKELNVAREDLVISTKLFWATKSDTLNKVGLSRKHVMEGINNSLKKLQLDYVDIVFCHRFDKYTPLEETCRAFHDIITSGKAHYWGTSEWTAAQIFEAFMICERFNLTKPVVEQPQYNMIFREKFEKEYGRLFDIYKYGSTVWSPLLGGILTGKYNDGIKPEEQSRLTTFSDNSAIQNQLKTYFGEENKAKYTHMLQGLAEIAKEIGCTQAQLAMAWVIKNKDVSTAITSASRPEQLEDIVGSVNFISKITPEIEVRINTLTGKRPDGEMDFRLFSPLEPRR